MSVDNMIHYPGEWLKGVGPNSDIVISSRIRLARNLSEYVFPSNLGERNTNQLLLALDEVTHKSKLLKRSVFLYTDDLSSVDKEILVERHLISKDHADAKSKGGVCVTEDEIVSIMVNEEDHLRMQTLQSGFNLLEAWRVMDQIDTDLGKKLNFPFDKKLGFLTACPTNLGTGLRASCMLHLPALVMTKQINKVVQALSKLDVAVRGLYGEGTQAVGNFFQFSNQLTLGKNEEKIIADLEKIVKQIISHETEARKTLKQKRKSKLEDQVWRAVGILKAARILSSQEANSLLSLVRLGCDLKLVPQLTQKQLNELFLLIQPAHLQKISKKKLSIEKRDITRATLIREKLEGVDL